MNAVVTRLAVPDGYAGLLAAVLRDGAGRGEPEWLATRRHGAFDRLRAMGFPTTRAEDWKYTNIRSLLDATFTLPRREPVPEVKSLIPHHLEDENELIFVDGCYAPEHSRFEPESGLHVVSLEDGLRNGDGEALRQRLAESLPGDDSPFVCLNAALSGCGVYVRVDRGVTVSKRIHLLFLTTGLQPGVMVSPRVVVDVGAGAQVRLAQSHIGRSGAAAFTNVVTDLHVGDNANVFYTKVQSEAPEAYHCSFVRSRQAASSVVTLLDFTIGAKLARNDLYAGLDGEGAELHLDGLYAVRGRQLVDHHTTVDHRVPRGLSRQIYKGILNDSARVVFNGKVLVRPGAKLTDGYQINQNLLLSRSATVNTKPQLEIANDDVKCTHGATIGQINEDQVFYLQSRGIAKDAAVAMLSRAFVEDVLFLVHDKPLQESLRALLATYFGK
ncbi:MAG: Fe-S cluster assembly protein SufD [Lentisphaerae bacterium]|nr:Fe-S cluster assembly protein SufD [Lentisphaerota bacterium]